MVTSIKHQTPNIMKTSLASFIAAICLISAAAHAASPEQEKSFLATYQKAFESNDQAALTSLLHTAGSPGEIIEFFVMMMTADAGKKLTRIELVTPSQEEVEKYNAQQEMPDGKMYVMGLKPVKQLVIVMEEKSDSGSSKSTSKLPVAEKDGKLVIPLPVPAK
jgi:hypothetical protein